jgi:hypothetical protein
MSREKKKEESREYEGQTQMMKMKKWISSCDDLGNS